jgi:hypothetical protein
MLFYNAYRHSTTGECYIIANSESLDEIRNIIREDVLKQRKLDDRRIYWWELATLDYKKPFEIISKENYI